MRHKGDIRVTTRSSPRPPIATPPLGGGPPPAIARSGARAETERQPLRIWDADGRLDHDAVCRLVDAAEVIVEGRIYESGVRVGADGRGAHAVFLGTALLTIDLSRILIADAPVNDAFVQRLRAALARGRRTLQPIRDRAWRETARLLGPETPYNLEVTPTLRARGTSILIDLDLEGHVERDPVEREIVDTVVALRDAGLSIRGIAAELAARGIHRPESQTQH